MQQFRQCDICKKFFPVLEQNPNFMNIQFSFFHSNEIKQFVCSAKCKDKYIEKHNIEFSKNYNENFWK